ncbi:hypothetical protein KSP39_PZI017474 [Platanthera zijinensis]|uniref:Uncharacterized protein n=1 Tax=Platanthera zijinensis TaxID=2320716 RepID=A0AAP0B5N2_9ASPA
MAVCAVAAMAVGAVEAMTVSDGYGVQELLGEMGHPEVPLSIISKAVEVQFLVVVDKVLLGNKWLRKATGIQPKLPYPVDSFEESKDG